MSLLSYYLSKDLKVPVTLSTLDYEKGHIFIRNLTIANPSGSVSSTAFQSEKIDIHSSLTRLFSNPLIIEDLQLSNVNVNIEYYDNGQSSSNWTILVKSSKKKKSSHRYLIKRVVINNLTVSITQSSGNTKTYPTLQQMVFYDISDESGIPVDQIEKAIFNEIIKSILREYSLPSLIKSIPGRVKSLLPF